RPRVAHVVREWIGKQGFVAAGLGVTLLPALAAASVRPDIAVVPVDGADLPPRPVFATVPAGRSGPPAAAHFLEALRGTAARIVRPAPPRGSRRRRRLEAGRGGAGITAGAAAATPPPLFRSGRRCDRGRSDPAGPAPTGGECSAMDAAAKGAEPCWSGRR